MHHIARLAARWAASGSLSIALLLTGCATEAPTTSTSSTRPKSVPGIAVLIDCGGCQVRSTVEASIRNGYEAAAAKAGVQVEGDRRVTLTIKDYTERGLAIRAVSFVAGPLAFALKDEIRAVASIDGKQLPLEYHYRNPLQGIEAVAQKLGELSFAAAVE